MANTSGSYTYDNAKGGMGRYSIPTVRWRLPTIHDYELAEVDGIRHVMPDMGAMGITYEWSATVLSSLRSNAWSFNSNNGNVNNPPRSTAVTVRCVAR